MANILLRRRTFVHAIPGALAAPEPRAAGPAPRYTAGVSDTRYSCVAAATFGLESVVRVELENLGIRGARAADRRVFFEGSARDIARSNLGLRTADRVLIHLAEYAAPDFDALYEGVRAVPWKDLLGARAAVDVAARSVKSRLASTPSIQSVAKRAVIDALRGTRGPGRPSDRLEETGTHYDVEVALHSDRASVCLDTTGPGLHKRGYRAGAGEAPLRENLAAALVLLSRWESPRPFVDPFCGSGTIPIEAALVAANIAPGIGRSFAAEAWPLIPAACWKEARERARAEEGPRDTAGIEGSDRDGGMIQACRGERARGGCQPDDPVSTGAIRGARLGGRLRLHGVQPAVWRAPGRAGRGGHALSSHGRALSRAAHVVPVRSFSSGGLPEALRRAGFAQSQAIQRKCPLLVLPVLRSSAVRAPRYSADLRRRGSLHGTPHTAQLRGVSLRSSCASCTRRIPLSPSRERYAAPWRGREAGRASCPAYAPGIRTGTFSTSSGKLSTAHCTRHSFSSRFRVQVE